MDFNIVKIAVAVQFERMQQGKLFRTGATGLWANYLGAFPPGTNPILNVRTEHDCACCRQFIRDVGNVVNSEMVSIWDVEAGEYQPIVDALSRAVKSQPIVDVFLHDSRVAGVDKNFQQVVDRVQTWTHFFVNIRGEHVLKREAIPTRLSELRSARDVFARSLAEIKPEAVSTVLDLLGTIYRGEEHRGLVTSFGAVQAKWLAGAFIEWSETGALAHIRNTVIGTLLVDLSEGKDIEAAVGAYEAKVAPMNYKRPTALVTQGMIDKAKATLTELGLVSALERRFTVMDDLSVNNLIWRGRSPRTGLDAIRPTAPVKLLLKPRETSILPVLKAQTVEILFESPADLVSLIAPVDPTALGLFKWTNRFSWSYNGDVADSIKEKVKKAGGVVEADLCCRLAWHNYDDLDLHLVAPGGHHISYAHKSVGGGRLDVDMNAGRGTTREGVENIFYADRRTMIPGEYTLFVRQYMQRESIDVGFEVEMDFLSKSIGRFVYDRVVKGDVIVAKFTFDGDAIRFLPGTLPTAPGGSAWGLTIGAFHPVSAVLLSPNHWDVPGIGLKHYFFIIDGCVNDGSARGFYNEFLSPELEKHRKVLEIVGSKMRVSGSGGFSGLGFSHKPFICRVNGSLVYRVTPAQA